MKLSEAIRLGAMLRPQGFGRFFTGNARIGRRSCALGAAGEAAGILNATAATRKWEDSWELQKRFPILATRVYGTSSDIHTVQGVIQQMNDDGMSREEIARWVEQCVEPHVEPHFEPAVEAQTAGLAEVTE